jgi:hypothetical protein
MRRTVNSSADEGQRSVPCASKSASTRRVDAAFTSDSIVQPRGHLVTAPSIRTSRPSDVLPGNEICDTAGLFGAIGGDGHLEAELRAVAALLDVDDGRGGMQL